MVGWNNYKSKEKIANVVSILTNAPIIAFFMFSGLSYYFLSGVDFIIVTMVTLIFSVLIPSIIAYTWIKNKNLEFDMPNKEDRLYPLLWILLSYSLGVIVLHIIFAPPVITVLMFYYFSSTMVILIISLFWKISIHSVWVAGPVAFLIYIFGYSGLFFLPIIPLVMWSRLFLKRHTPIQVIAGASMGFVLITVQIYFFLGF
jgi:membrane-associated phospholipid phosphatase